MSLLPARAVASNMKELSMSKSNLKEVLTKEGITQSKLHVKTGLSIGTINKICNNRRQCSPTTSYRILKGVNDLTNTEYSIEDIFPNSK
jgi:transcriptional regulator with XRE-family HTH domain